MKNHKILTIAATSLMALTGCTLLTSPEKPVFEGQRQPAPTASYGQDETLVEDSSVHETPTATPSAKASPSTSAPSPSAASSPDAVDRAFPERQMPFADADAYWRANSDIEPGQGRLTLFAEPADPAKYPLTEEEKTQVAEGKYVPATNQHPAFNLPTPEVPAALAQGGRAEETGIHFFNYWLVTLNYLVLTGQTDELDAITLMPNPTVVGNQIAAYTNIYNEGTWFQGCTYKAEATEGTQVVTDGKTVNIYIPAVLKQDECSMHDGKNTQTDPALETKVVAQVSYAADTKKYTFVGFIEATGKYYELPLQAKALVCTYTPISCPQDAYDALRAELKQKAGIHENA